MKKKEFLWSLLAMLMVATLSVGLTSCGDDDDPDNVSVSMPSVNFGESGGSQSIQVTSNTKWNVAGAPEWLTVAPTQGSNNGTITLSASSNTEKNGRNCVLYINAGSASATVTVNQSGKQKSTRVTITNSTNYTFKRFTVHFVNSRMEELPDRDFGTLYPNSTITADIPSGATEYYMAFYESRWRFSPNYSIEDSEMVITDVGKWTANSSASQYPKTSSAN